MANLLTPVGRMVAGSLYKPNTTDWQGAPMIIKTGPNAGQPRTEYFFAVAIAKGGEQHWSQTEWGQLIYTAACTGFPNGEPQRPDFAWKITDGDSQVPNKRNVAPCSKVGYPGHWVLSFSSSFAPKIYNADGTQAMLEPDAVKCGYFVQVSGDVAPNGNPGNPGVYLNHSMVAMAAYGDVISSGPDAATVGFGGNVALPAGASMAPPAGGAFNPAPQQVQQQPTPQAAYQPQGGFPAPQQQQPNQFVPGQQQPQQQPQQAVPGPAGYAPPQQVVPNGQGQPTPQNGQPQTAPAAGFPPPSQGAAPGAMPVTPAAAQYVNPGMPAQGAPAAGPGPGVTPGNPNFMGGQHQ